MGQKNDGKTVEEVKVECREKRQRERKNVSELHESYTV